MSSPTYDLVLRGGTVVTSSPEQPFEISKSQADVGILNGKIEAVGEIAENSGKTEISVAGQLVCPGFIDTQVHFREPGLEHKEDLNTGTEGAIAGGITAVFEMPNTSPNTISEKDYFAKVDRVKDRAWCDVAFYIGACAENAQDLGELETLPGCSGVKMFMGSSTGSLLVDQDEVLEQVVKNGKRRFAVHCEDEARLIERKELVKKDGVTVHDHPVWRDEETAMIATKKIVELAKKHNRPVHVLHVTTKQEMKYLAENKDHCTVECTPQHLTLSAPDCYDRLGTLAQMNPPIRTEDHTQGLWEGVDNGTVDIIGSDHAPHTLEEKGNNYPNTPSGMTGVQTILPIMLNHVNNGKLSFDRLFQMMVINPIHLFKLKNRGYIQPGYEATLTVIDMEHSKTITNDWIKSRSGWTPFHEMTTKGWPTYAFLRGEMAMEKQKPLGNPRGQMLEFEN